MLPELPAISELLPGYSATTWFGMWVPLNTPKEIANKLNQGIVRALKLPDVQERLKANGMESGGNSPDQFNQFVVEEIAKYTRVVKNGNIRVE